MEGPHLTFPEGSQPDKQTPALHAQRKLWQGCGKNPDFTAKTDIIDKFPLSESNNLRGINAGLVYPAYRLIRYFCLK